MDRAAGVMGGEDPLQRLLPRAAGLVPALRDRAARTEQARQVLPETVRDLVDSGLIRAAVPPRYGGLGLDYGRVFELVWELGRGCGSTGWCYGLWVLHNWWAGHFPPRAQEEFFANGPDVLCASGVDPSGATAEAVDGGYRVTGRWRFCSGCDSAQWSTLTISVEGGLRRLMVPASDYRIEDTWFVSGMRGTGSKDIVVEDRFVPAYRAVDAEAAGDTVFTGWEQHRLLSYRAPLRTLTGWELAAAIVGMAQGAVDAFTARLYGTSGPGRTAESPAVQLRLAQAAALVDAARLVHLQAIGRLLRRAERGDRVTPLERARTLRDRAYAGKLAVQSVNTLFEAAGAHAIAESDPLQRFHRDIHAATHHAGMNWDNAAAAYGKGLLAAEK